MKPDLAANLRRADRCVVVSNHLQNAERSLKRLNHTSPSPRVLSWALPTGLCQHTRWPTMPIGSSYRGKALHTEKSIFHIVKCTFIL